MRGQRGFTLVEMVVVIAVLGVLFTILMGITRAVVSQQRYQTTRTRMANVDNALTVFVSQYKRLPCPADGRNASGVSGAGMEAASGSGTSRTCNNSQQHGVVPWATLGLTASDIEDGWGGRFTYRVAPDVVLDGSLDFSSCDPAGSGPINATAPVPPWCTAAGTGAGQCNSSTLATNCTSPNNALTQSTTKGLVVENTSGAILMDPRNTGTPPVSTGAAYVLVSHGPEGGGAYDGNGILQASTVSAGTLEAKNFADVAYAAPGALPAAPAWFMVDGAVNATTSAAHFDDLVSRPGILSLSNRAQLGPRSH